MDKVTHFMYMPLLGLGLYGGHRGARWLKGRIRIFKQFVLPSLLAQTSKNFILWVSVRHEDRYDPLVKELRKFLEQTEIKTVFTYSGVCFWDDKYDDKTAKERLISALHGSMGELYNVIGEAKTVLMSIQPSDDCYHKNMVKEVQELFNNTDCEALGYQKGYVMDYRTLALKEWNPKTNPPFYTIKFTRETFTDPFKHMKYIGPYQSHEYVSDYLKYLPLQERGFLVGTHDSNISTVFDHPYAGADIDKDTLADFGLQNVDRFKPEFSIFAPIFRALPYSAKRKLRYWSGEKKWIFRPLFAFIYNILRS